MNKSHHNYCLNCNSNFPDGHQDKKEIFCINCGQSVKESRLSIIKLIKDGISNIFNLDSRLIHTFRDIIYPAKLTRTYIEGRRKYYVNPARLFLFMLIGIITVSLWLVNLEDTTLGGDIIHSRSERSTMLVEYDDLVDTLPLKNKGPVTDIIRSRLFNGVRKPDRDSIGMGNNMQLFGLNKKVQNFGISSYDAIHLSEQEILKKYDITDFWDRQYVSQYIRIINNPASSIAFIIKNLTWAVLLTIVFLSLFMKLLYFRREYYLVEHAVLLLNLHSFLFVILSIFIICNTLIYNLIESVDDAYNFILLGVLLAFALIVQFLAIKKYYRHGLFRALLSQTMINSAYVITFFLSGLFVSILSVFLF